MGVVLPYPVSICLSLLHGFVFIPLWKLLESKPRFARYPGTVVALTQKAEPACFPRALRQDVAMTGCVPSPSTLWWSTAHFISEMSITADTSFHRPKIRVASVCHSDTPDVPGASKAVMAALRIPEGTNDAVPRPPTPRFLLVCPSEALKALI